VVNLNFKKLIKIGLVVLVACFAGISLLPLFAKAEGMPNNSVFNDNLEALTYQLRDQKPVDSAIFVKALEQLANKKSHILTLLLPETGADGSTQILATDLYSFAKQMPDAVIEFKSANNSILLPVKIIEFAALETKLGSALFNNLLLTVTMELADQSSTDAFKLALADKILVSPIINFSIVLEAGGKQEMLTDFNGKYISTTFELDEQTNPNELTVLTLDESTGQLAFVPAIFQTVDGKTKVTLKSPHDSHYGVVRSQKNFMDINGHWAKKDLELLASKGLLKGASETIFAPDNSVTRAEFTSMLARALGLKDDKQAAAILSDVTQDKWYAGAVGAAVKAGIVSGYKEGTFGADDLVTREQIAVMLGNALKFLQASVNIRERQDIVIAQVIDQQKISIWAMPSVAQLLDTGIINGRTDHSFAPQDAASCAEAATMLVRFLQFVHFIN
jgi:hypothetical protein